MKGWGGLGKDCNRGVVGVEEEWGGVWWGCGSGGGGVWWGCGRGGGGVGRGVVGVW